jgi:hypothetical protein
MTTPPAMCGSPAPVRRRPDRRDGRQILLQRVRRSGTVGFATTPGTCPVAHHRRDRADHVRLRRHVGWFDRPWYSPTRTLPDRVRHRDRTAAALAVNLTPWLAQVRIHLDRTGPDDVHAWWRAVAWSGFVQSWNIAPAPAAGGPSPGVPRLGHVPR